MVPTDQKIVRASYRGLILVLIMIIWNYLGCVMERILLELLRVRNLMLF